LKQLEEFPHGFPNTVLEEAFAVIAAVIEDYNEEYD
jgi:hypothetical protein